MSDGTIHGWPRYVLQAEAATIFAGAIWAYARSGQSWWIFASGLLLPDLGMVGYLSNTKLGSIFYNAVHTETPPIVLLCAGYARQDPRIVGPALIWLAHIGMDRMLGFGLKYHDSFQHTHLGVMGGSTKTK
ncbi:hypothetical protein LTR97_010667 [Elasticomyces elasticus]|uniref:DUF4260 domain-containing protein n=1 Tax=Elasticomyces elasticus TaxID=574655 RepID=A0AAN7ZYV5_9PEZI|nr:hypothetical protein LTR97_010667 [Elasticomyces elasticus]